MSEIPPIVVQILAETAQLKEQMASAQASIARFGGAAHAAEAPIGRMHGQFKELGATMLKSFAVLELVKVLMESGKVAAEDADSFAQMSDQLKTTTGATKEQTKAVDEHLEKLSDMSGVFMSKIRPSYSTFLRTTGDATKSLKLQQIALDVSARTGKDLSTVTLAMSRAYAGNGASLNKLVPGIKGVKDQMGYLQKTFHGAAKTAAEANPYKQLSQTMEKLKVAIGTALMPVIKAMTQILRPLIPVFAFLGKIIGYVMMEVMKLVNPLFKLLMPILTALMPVIMRLVRLALKPMIDVLVILLPVIEPIVKIILIMSGVIDKALITLTNFTDYIKNNFISWLKKLGDQFSWVFNILNPVLDAIASILGIDLSPTIKPEVDTSGLNGVVDTTGLMPTADTAGTKLTSTESAAVKLKRENDKALAKAHKDYQKQVLDANNAYKTEVQKQIDDFRNIFRDATRVDIGELWSMGYRSADAMIGALKQRLTAMTDFASDVGKLAAAGYSSDFVKEVMAQGPFLGDQMAQALLSASPQAQAQIKELFAATQDVSANGVTKVAEGLQDMFVAAANTLTEALKTAAETLKDAVIKISDKAQAVVNKPLGGNPSPAPTPTPTPHPLANTQIVVNANSNAPADQIARAVVNGLKFGTPIVSAPITPTVFSNWMATPQGIPTPITH